MKAFAIKPDDLGLIPGVHVVKEESDSHRLPSCGIGTPHAHAHSK